MQRYSREEYEAMFGFLDELRESGAVNMFGAGPYLRKEFGMEKDESFKVMKAWQDTFGDGDLMARAERAAGND